MTMYGWRNVRVLQLLAVALVITALGVRTGWAEEKEEPKKDAANVTEVCPISLMMMFGGFYYYHCEQAPCGSGIYSTMASNRLHIIGCDEHGNCKDGFRILREEDAQPAAAQQMKKTKKLKKAKVKRHPSDPNSTCYLTDPKYQIEEQLAVLQNKKYRGVRVSWMEGTKQLTLLVAHECETTPDNPTVELVEDSNGDVKVKQTSGEFQQGEIVDFVVNP